MGSPTLLVGLGGTGSKIVAKVSSMISEEQRRYISCVIFDTDVNDLPLIKEKNPEIHVVQTSARMTVGEYLEEDHYARDNWFPLNPRLNRKVLSEGAGQVRSVSRLGFESAVRIGKMEPLHEAIQDLFKVDDKKTEQSLRVMIVSSLAGGTGSGLIVPVGMYIQHYVKTKFQLSGNIQRGFFILPEIFYGAVPADQRDNLKSNAYASLRELDAFMMKGDEALSEEYSDSVRLEMPVAGTDRHEEYDELPYNFCFLFDAQNSNGEKLNSLEQYTDHAANILYSMSFGAINKRINSAEDNVIRTLSKGGGRNRYAGAGASRLIYPYEDICQLIGLSWASKSITDQWLEYDRQFVEDNRKAQKRREEGYYVKEVSRSDKYTTALETDSKGNKPFAMAIVKSVNPESDSALYENYVEAVDGFLKSDISADDELKTAEDKIRNILKNTSDKKSSVKDTSAKLNQANSAIDDYLKTIDQYIERRARDLGYTLFEGASNQGKLDEPYYLENVIENNGNYLHPNAVRYLLIKIKDLLEDTKPKEVNGDKSQLLKRLEKPDTNGKGFDKYKDKVLPWQKKKFDGEVKAVTNNLNKALKDVNDYLYSSLKEKVYTHGIQYISDLIFGFEAFYDAFESEVGILAKKQEDIKKRYNQAPGMTVRYVAASRKALDTLVKRYPYTGSLISVDKDLSRRIVDKTFAYTKKINKPNPSRYFGELFEDQILEHYQESANKKLNKELDNGILEAIRLEADLLLDEDLKESQIAVDQYVRDVLESTRNLSTPFIEKPSEINASPIYACAFHPSLLPAHGDESYEAKLVQEELIEKGGTPDKEIDRNVILFYQSYYGLRANALSKFSPPKNSLTYKRNGGEYFNAYAELIRGIHPNNSVLQEISPHIDRRWHLAAKMPDLDEGNQIIEEYGINAAFFWVLVLDYLKYRTESNGQGVFELDTRLMKMDGNDGALLIDEHNRASKLAEVLQALTIQPSFVHAVRELARERTDNSIKFSKTVEKSDIYNRINNIETWLDPQWIGLPEIEDGEKCKVSLFEIPLILKASTPVGTFSDAKLSDLLKVMFREAISYISGFCSPEELAGKIQDFVEGQYLNFKQRLKEIKAENSENGTKVLQDELIPEELKTVGILLQEYGVYELSADLISTAKQKLKM